MWDVEPQSQAREWGTRKGLVRNVKQLGPRLHGPLRDALGEMPPAQHRSACADGVPEAAA